MASIALGACFIEKHFIMQRSDGGPDSAFWLEPDELSALVTGTKLAFDALGSGDEARSEIETGSMIFRRSLYVVLDMQQGETFTENNVRIIRPGFGLAPKELPNVIGRKATRGISHGSRLSWDLID